MFSNESVVWGDKSRVVSDFHLCRAWTKQPFTSLHLFCIRLDQISETNISNKHTPTWILINMWFISTLHLEDPVIVDTVKSYKAFWKLLLFVIYLFDRDDAVKHSYQLAADVMHIEFMASANFQLQSPLGSSTTIYCKYTSSTGLHYQ